MAITPTISAVAASTPIALRGVSPGQLPASVVCGLSNGGSLTYSVEVTAANFDALTNSFPDDNWAPLPGAAGLTASAAIAIPMKASAVRVRVTSYASGSISLAVAQ